MAVFKFVWAVKRMCGKMMVGWVLSNKRIKKACSGAYCAMVIIALLDLPPELPPDASARRFGFDTFASGLPEYLTRCRMGMWHELRSRLMKCLGQTFEGG